MFVIKGKYNEAKVFASEVDSASLGQIKTLCDQEFTQGSRIRLMPDVHAGKGCTIGTTMTVSDKIVPNLVGVDIGCGMETVKLKEQRVNLPQLDKLIYRAIPRGTAIRKQSHKFLGQIDLESLRCAAQVDLKRAALSLGTLGGGNHFIEVSTDEKGALYLVIHSGSRFLGHQVADYYQEVGIKKLKESGRYEILERRGRGEDQAEALCSDKPQIPRELAFVEGQLFEDYVHDMHLTQQYALLNRQAMVEEIVKGLNLHVEEQFSTIHNYLDTEAMILRKGAVSAKVGEKLLIPINMRDGSLICEGLGNHDWNFSAPHGAGRLMSRTAAKNSFTVSAFKKTMEGIYSTSVCRGTLDECPMAYKDAQAILENIGPTAKVLKTLKPIYNFKAA